MKRKYYIPYLCVTLPLVGIMTALLFLIGRMENHAAIARHERAAFIVAAILIFTALDRLWKQQRIYRMFGCRSYPGGMLVISTLTLMATPFLCLLGEYGVAVVAQVVAGGCYLHAWCLYEQERLTN